ncbi:DUF1292 domain-containing protein [Vallitaleaceae bacterium 9-2]
MATKDHNHCNGDCSCSEHSCDCSGHEKESITLTLEDDTTLVCQIIDSFTINEQTYIALLHPDNHRALLYRFDENDDHSINLEMIDEDEEFELVSKTFLSLQDSH